MTLVDSHCHLTYPGLVERQAEVVEAARAAGVATLLTIATREREWDEVAAVAHARPGVWASVGVHPHEADAHTHVDAAALIARADDPRVVGLGECGLDYHYQHSSREAQGSSFRQHIAAARATGLPVIIHTRDAEDDTAAILAEEMAAGAFTAVLHCFTGTETLARAGLDLGLFVSLSGIVTFKSARALQDVARMIPRDRLLVETDAPFLAPVPHRGHRCEPAFVADTARFLAELRGERFDALAQATTDNFHRLFARTQACG